MTEHKFTDDEVIKALECCNDSGGCDNCPFDGAVYEDEPPCVDKLTEAARNLINRQKAEIERLNTPQGVTFLANGIEIHAKDSDEYYKFKRLVKAEAITEFAEKLKDMHKHSTTSVVSLVTLFGDINKMVKEMTEDINDT